MLRADVKVKWVLISAQFYFQLLYLFAILDFINENLGRLKAWYVMLINDQCRVPRNVSRDLLFALLVDKASETTDVNIIPVGHGTLNYAKECLNGRCYISFVNSSLFCDFVNNVCFGHCVIFLVELIENLREGKFKCRLQN